MTACSAILTETTAKQENERFEEPFNRVLFIKERRGKTVDTSSFIAADRELPLGSFRDQTEEGLISIVKLDPGYEMVKTKLSKPFVYEATGCLHRPGNDIRALFSYINSNIPEGEDIEVYSCWDGEEDKEKTTA
ncbi:hypothetical protein PO124_30630 [Bacillus licheniformis]|nr:hypothetical protein [Bacillus licheniformis]